MVLDTYTGENCSAPAAGRWLVRMNTKLAASITVRSGDSCMYRTSMIAIESRNAHVMDEAAMEEIQRTLGGHPGPVGAIRRRAFMATNTAVQYTLPVALT